jgi:hypothetical protein
VSRAAQAHPTFRDLEWQVARMRRAIERYEEREEDEPGKGQALLLIARDNLDAAVLAFAEAIHHATDERRKEASDA